MAEKVLNVLSLINKFTQEEGSFQGPDGKWEYTIKGEIGGKLLKEGPKLKWRCILTTPKGVFMGKGKGKDGAIEKALNKANEKYGH